MTVSFDHLVVAAKSLEAGGDWVQQHTGLSIPPGGKHLQMSTHNRVLSLGSSSYLEIIATDPDTLPPDRPRWFGLDESHIIKQLETSPCLLTWVVRTTDLNKSIAGGKKAGVDPGVPAAMSRGSLNWRIAIRNDGRLMEKGVFPTLIEWPISPTSISQPLQHSTTKERHHHADLMQDKGLRLETFELHHPDKSKLYEYLDAIGMRNPPQNLDIHEGPHNLLAQFLDSEGKVRTLEAPAQQS